MDSKWRPKRKPRIIQVVGQSRSVLVLGPSTITFSEPGEAASISALTEAELRRAVPGVEWRCSPEMLFIRPSMAERAFRVASASGAEAYVLVSNSRPFDEDVFVAWALHHHPRLYPAAQWLVERLKGLAGAKAEDRDATRGLLFRLPREFARQLFGREPFYDVEDAIGFAKEAVDSLLRIEDAGLVFAFLPGSRALRRESQRRIRRFHDALSAYCRQRRVPYCFRYDVSAEAGQSPDLSSDGLHADRRTRELDANAIARLVTSVLAASMPDKPSRALSAGSGT